MSDSKNFDEVFKYSPRRDDYDAAVMDVAPEMGHSARLRADLKSRAFLSRGNDGGIKVTAFYPVLIRARERSRGKDRQKMSRDTRRVITFRLLGDSLKTSRGHQARRGQTRKAQREGTFFTFARCLLASS